jgi:YbgC/YbaW family acyl-CoA thioester hydrolase
MHFTHTEDFRIRQYECDLYGHVNNAVYLHYLMETALCAFRAGGMCRDHLAEIGLREWLPMIDIEYLAPIFYGESVEVTFRPAGIQDGILFGEFEFRKTPGMERVARATANIIFLNTRKGTDAPIPKPLVDAFFPGGNEDLHRNPTPFPTAPAPPPGTFKTRRRTAWTEVNAAQEIDHAVLLSYIEDCGRQVVAVHGWPMDFMLEKGFAILLRRNQIEYRTPAVFDEELEIATWVSNVRRVTAIRHYSIARISDGTQLAQVHALGVWVNLGTGQPIRIPPDLLADFAPNIVA